MIDADLFRSILDALADPVFVKDRSHTWRYANPAFCAFVGLPLEKVVGFTDSDYFPPEQYEVFYAMDDAVFAAGGMHENEEHIVGADGTVRVIHTKKTITSADGEPVLVGIIRDLTELRRAEEEATQRRRAEIRAEEANLAKSRFLANMSHELRTPLNGVIGYTEMLYEELEDPDQQATLDQVLSASQHLLSMIDQVLDLSRIEAGRVQLTPEPVELAAMITQVTTSLEPLATAAGSDFELACTEATLTTDARSLRQVLLNLIENALKYASPGTVRIRCEPVGTGARIEVADDGPGIDADQREHLFEKFWRADPSSRVTGSGLGLSIAREMTAQLGGTLEVESTPGRGSTFVVSLPSM